MLIMDSPSLSLHLFIFPDITLDLPNFALVSTPCLSFSFILHPVSKFNLNVIICSVQLSAELRVGEVEGSFSGALLPDLAHRLVMG